MVCHLRTLLSQCIIFEAGLFQLQHFAGILRASSWLESFVGHMANMRVDPKVDHYSSVEDHSHPVEQLLDSPVFHRMVVFWSDCSLKCTEICGIR